MDKSLPAASSDGNVPHENEKGLGPAVRKNPGPVTSGVRASPPQRMTTLQPQTIDAKKTDAVPAGLEFQGCFHCGARVVYCRIAGGKRGTRPVAVEVAPKGNGNIGISDDLFSGAGAAPYAFELSTSTSRYRLHGPACPGPLTHSRFVRRKTK